MAAPELNWSGTYVYRAQQVYRPQTIDELQRLTETATSSLHAIGTRHSFTDIADASGLITLEALPGEVTIDEDARTVSVPGSMRYGDLARHLQETGWALSNLPSLPHISIAGSVATATHGSGQRQSVAIRSSDGDEPHHRHGRPSANRSHVA
jgi:alditol oxidase